jgi:2-(3-amino-3-carboxypropyl)histidine synthase
MKNVFIETRYSGKLDFPLELVDKLPNKLMLGCSVQFLDQLAELKELLESSSKKITLFQSQHARTPGQVLGCDLIKFDGDAFLYLGDGLFHPSALGYDNDKPVFIYNPFTKQLTELDKGYWARVKKRKQALQAKLLTSTNVGILVTRKPGQNQSQAAEIVREKLEAKGKKVFVFLADEINTQKLEDFNFIDVWVNSACPRIVEDFPCLNLGDLSEIGF